MSLSCLMVWLLMIQLYFFSVVSGELCPVCTNKYDHKSCTQTRSCDANSNYCELIVKPDDFYSLEYVCKQASECANQATVECDPSVNKTCIYCCDGPTICQLQREELYNNEFPSSSLLDPSTTQGIECPVCFDVYDYTTCSGIQTCPFTTDGLCQLVIKTTGQLKLDYQCGHYEICAGQEAAGCHPKVNNTCTFCCSDPVTCQLQRDDLFTYELPSLGLPTDILATTTTAATTATSASTATPTTRTASAATESPVTTVSQTTSTVAPATATETTATSTATQTTSTQVATIETEATATATSPPATQTTAEPTITQTTEIPTTTPQTTMPSTTPPLAPIRCVQCGDYSGHTSCTDNNHVLNKPEVCPINLRYCFTRFTQNGNDTSVYKGCATAEYCTLEYELTSTKKECDDPDLTALGHVSCGYCCNRNDCNAHLKPPDSSLVAFD